MAQQEDALAAAWQAYHHTGDGRAHDELVERYLPLVRYVAGRLAVGLPNHVDTEDLYSYGVFGLLDALARFDPGRGIKFETYAFSRVRGAMLDGLREMDWVPAALRQKARRLEQVYGQLESSLGRAATDEEAAAAMDVDADQFRALLRDVSRATVLSLDDAAWGGGDGGEGGLALQEVIRDESSEDPMESAFLQERKRILADAIAKLPDRERTVVGLYYYDGLTATEIARVLGLSVSRISQLHSRAVLRLRGRLSRQKEALR